MFRIKICGITIDEDVHAAFRLGAHTLGLNFYEKSTRYISVERAAKLSFSRLVPSPSAIGVFVNADLATICGHVERLALSGIQLHGDEPPEFLTDLPDVPIVRARRMDDRGVAAIAADLEACEAAGRLPDAVLVDAYTPGRYGGTGETVSWSGLADYRKWLGNIPLILAGGLTPDNVAEAIRTVRPYGVDTASGVERSPGVKDHAKMQSFIQNAKVAFEQISRD